MFEIVDPALRDRPRIRTVDGRRDRPDVGADVVVAGSRRAERVPDAGPHRDVATPHVVLDIADAWRRSGCSRRRRRRLPFGRARVGLGRRAREGEGHDEGDHQDAGHGDDRRPVTFDEGGLVVASNRSATGAGRSAAACRPARAGPICPGSGAGCLLHGSRRGLAARAGIAADAAAPRRGAPSGAAGIIGHGEASS